MIDSIPIPICRGARYNRPREQVEASGGRGSLGWVMGYKLHAVVSAGGMFKRFAVVGANVADPTVAKVLLDPHIDDLSAVLGDCAYLGCGVTAPSRSNAKKPTIWTTAMRKTRKMIETVFSRMVRCGLLVFGQLNSFRSVRTKVCRKVAMHNLLLYLTH
ncbi:transposase (plasmid) [Deinococcus sp. PESE-38]